jgi:hypothetical protein
MTRATLRGVARVVPAQFVAKILGEASEGHVAIIVTVSLAVGASAAAGLGAGAKRFLKDVLDGARTTAALGAATETSVELLGIAGKVVRATNRVADIVIGQDVAGTNDHEKDGPSGGSCSSSVIFDIEERRRMQKEKPRFEAIPNWPSANLE